MRLTKNDMARVIIQALYDEVELPPADNVNVRRLARRKMRHLRPSYAQAHRILTDRVRGGA